MKKIDKDSPVVASHLGSVMFSNSCLQMTLQVTKGTRGQPRTHWQNYVEDLAWSHFGIPPAKLPLAVGDWDAWRFQLKLLCPQPQKDKQAKENTCTRN